MSTMRSAGRGRRSVWLGAAIAAAASGWLGAAAVIGHAAEPPARPPVPQAEDVADLPVEDRSAGGDERKRYLLIGPRPGEAVQAEQDRGENGENGGGGGDAGSGKAAPGPAPENGYKLLIVMPGGPGTIDFHPFVKRIHKNALPPGYLVAQPVSVRWSEEQAKSVVWPTSANKPPEAGFTTEEFIDAVVADVKERHAINDRYIFTLSWSSSGPAAYAAALRDQTPITGSLVAMSVYKPEQLPPRENAEGRAFYILHSPEDRACPFWMAEKARDELKENGAAVEFRSYNGGHGWRGPVFEWIGTGVAWLEGEVEKGEKKAGDDPE